ncbi:microfibril-associated glycoprotein 4-like [Littorina saxatilis]
MQCVWVLVGVTVCGWWVQRAVGEESLCQSMAYRGLPVAVQNEHQCMILERLQQDAEAHKMQADTHFAQLLSRINKVEHSLVRKLSRRSHRSNVNSGTGFPSLKGVPVARDCYELWMSGVRVSGVYAVKLSSGLVQNVYCDMDTDGGGWTLIQRRFDGSLNFTRGWNDYAFGFGNVNSEFWLGNENLHSLTRDTNYTLRVDLWDWDGQHAYAKYSFMRVAGETDDYRLRLGAYNGTAGDSFSYHSGMRFTTPDRDHDLWWASCGKKDQSGWWFNACSYCSLNGVYHDLGNASTPRPPSPDGTHTGIQWFHWKADPTYSLQRVTMMLKPKVAVTLQRLGRLPDPVYG